MNGECMVNTWIYSCWFLLIVVCFLVEIILNVWCCEGWGWATVLPPLFSLPKSRHDTNLFQAPIRYFISSLLPINHCSTGHVVENGSSPSRTAENLHSLAGIVSFPPDGSAIDSTVIRRTRDDALTCSDMRVNPYRPTSGVELCSSIKHHRHSQEIIHSMVMRLKSPWLTSPPRPCAADRFL